MSRDYLGGGFVPPAPAEPPAPPFGAEMPAGADLVLVHGSTESGDPQQVDAASAELSVVP